MSEILYERHKNEYGDISHRTVTRLSSDGLEHSFENMRELHVKQLPEEVCLIRFKEKGKARKFELSDAELEALIQARAQFKVRMIAFEASEKERIDAEIEQADMLIMSVRSADRHWELEYNEPANRYVLVCMHPELAGEYQREVIIYSMMPRDVLHSVKNYLAQKKLIELEPVPVPANGDGFDPLLDGNDLP